MKEKDKLKKRTNIFIAVLAIVLLVICGIFIYTITNNKEKSYIETEYDKRKKEYEKINNNSKLNDNIIKIDTALPKTQTVKLGNKNVDVNVSGKEDSAEMEIMINNKIINPSQYPLKAGYDKLYIIKNEIVLLSIFRGYGGGIDLYFYDENINPINVNFQFEDGYTMKPDDVVKVEENILTVKATNESVLNNYSTGDDYVTFCKNINIDDYKGQLSEAKYEIKYLGDGLFSSPKRIGEEKYINEECQRVMGN